jgi:hypothetical protein
MDNTEFKKFADNHPFHKIELLLPQDKAEKSGIIIFADGAFQMISYAMLSHVGHKFLVENYEATDDRWISHQEMQQYVQELDYREITICMKKKHLGVLVKSEQTVMDADSDSDDFFFFAFKYISSFRSEKEDIALIAYVPKSDGEKDLFFFGHIPEQFYDLLASVAENVGVSFDG